MEAVRQGFICPFCMDDLGDFPSLQSHVNSAHPENTGDVTDSVVQNVRGFFEKAKRGIRTLDAKMSVDLNQVNMGVSSSVADLASYASSVQEKVQEKTRPQRPPAVVRPPPVRPEIGATRSHSSFFHSCRDSSVNELAVHTNMLIIRLDRLINECPTDTTKRKEFEREVVPWSDDAEYPVCRSCAAKFGLTRRRHHCRLCGRVMCHQCSRFLSFLSARKLTNPALAASMAQEEPSSEQKGSPSNGRKLLEMTQKTTERMKMMLEGAVQRMNNDGSEVSLGSLLQQDASECLRLCSSCLSYLRRREEMMEQRVPPALAEQYATLDQYLSDIGTLAPTYARMAASINNGETMYTLKAAELMRQKVFQKQKDIDGLSKMIVTVADSAFCNPKEAQLRKNIRFVAVHTLQSVLSGMISLPTAEQYSQLVEEHKDKIARQIEEARIAQENRRQHKEKPPVVPTARARSSSPAANRRIERKKVQEEGWTPQQTKSYNPFLEEEDMLHPLFEQRDIIKGYLSQAAAAGRLEEVEMLERNLHDLEDEMRKMGLETNE